MLSGLEVCRILRGRPETAHIPIIMLTARTSESDRVTGLDVGADDYIVKPFSLRELTARVRAMLRRGVGRRPRRTHRSTAASTSSPTSMPWPCSVDGEQMRLTRREFELLRYLVENRNRVLSRDRLLERVWGYDRRRNPLGRRARRAAAREARHRRTSD